MNHPIIRPDIQQFLWLSELIISNKLILKKGFFGSNAGCNLQGY